jgi:protein ImuB
LPLEVFPGTEDRAAIAVVDGEPQGRRIHLANAAACRAGVRPGLALNAALALSPGLRLLERAPRREADALRRLSAWATRYSSLVSAETPQRLLLEIRGSLKLFGGLERLYRTVGEGLGAVGYTARRAVAPTPRAALWLARASDGAIVTARERLAGGLGPLPLTCTGWSERTLSLLEGVGVQTVADCLRLPREGLSRRIGPARVADMDHALGYRPEPREGIRLPPVYRGSLDLPAETVDRALLGQAMARLLEELAGFLRGHQSGVQQPAFQLRHADGSRSRIPFGFAEPTADPGFLLELLEPRLERIRLAVPVVGVALRSGPLLPLSGVSGCLDLSDDAADRHAPEPAHRLVERLRSRLGSHAVNGLCLLAEHRPEIAWGYVEPGTAGAGAGNGRRPFWILEEPQRLQEREGRPCLDGLLRMERGPERIETGWWDGHDVARDYFVAVCQTGSRLWVFRERRRAGGWYLHGIFG